MPSRASFSSSSTRNSFPTFASSSGRDPRVTVLNTDALHLPETLREMGHSHCDYIVSGLPFFVIESRTKDRLLQSIARAMSRTSRFITYQVTTQLCDHDHLFELASKEYCPLNFPPINVLEFRKAAAA